MLNNLAVDYTYTYTTTNTDVSSVSGSTLALIFIPVGVLVILLIIAMWKVFKKAGKPGWASIVPIYNTWVLFEITGYPAWLSLLSVIPGVNLIPAIVNIMADFKLAKLFGKSDLFGVMNVLFPFVTIPILGFGKAQFQGTPTGSTSSNPLQSFDPTNAHEAASFTPQPAETPAAAPPASSPTPTAEAPKPENPVDPNKDQTTPPSNPIS